MIAKTVMKLCNIVYNCYEDWSHCIANEHQINSAEANS